MAFSSLGTIGSNQSASANQASITLTTATTSLSAGNLAVLIIAVDNQQTTDGYEGAVTSVTSTGNEWRLAAEFTNGQGSAQTGATVSIWYSVLNAALNTGSVITVNFSNASNRDAAALTGWGFSRDTAKRLRIAGTATLANDGADPGSLDVTTQNIEHLRVRGIAGETNSTTALTATTNWTAFTGNQSASGGAAANQAVRGEFRIVTATTAASDPTFTAVDCASAYVAFWEDNIDKLMMLGVS